MYKLDQIYDQASKDEEAMKSYGNGYVNLGVKIQKFDSKIEILNCGRNGDYFKECSEREYRYFTTYGWVEGCIRLALSNYRRKLNMIERRIKTEVNTRKNDKHIQRLKASRKTIVNKYSKRKKQLNKITNGKQECI